MIKILTPVQPAPVMEIAQELLPPGMQLLVVDPAQPEFYDVAGDAEYYLGSPRFGIGNEFFRAAPKLKLVQLTSAGYDRVDLEAARKAGVPVANNLRPARDHHAIMGQATQHPVERGGEPRVLDGGHDLALTDAVPDSGPRAERPADRGIDVAVSRVPGDRTRFASQRQRGAVGHDRAELLPARLDHEVDGLAGHEVWSKPDGPSSQDPRRGRRRSCQRSGRSRRT
ncbi:MAG: hypothetical protein ACREKS_04055 [Candidatus Rokuibacteriota bacterium]